MSRNRSPDKSPERREMSPSLRGSPSKMSQAISPSKASPSKRLIVKYRIDEEQMAEIKEVFVLFDTEHSGSLDCRELKAAMRTLGFEIRKDELMKVMADMGKDIFDTVDFDEFVDIIEPRLQDKNSVDEVAKIFRLFDDDQTQKISLRNLKRVCAELGENLSEQDLQEIIECADRTGDGQLTFEEFYNVVSKRDYILA